MAWEQRGGAAREWQHMLGVLEVRASAAYDRCQAYVTRCPRRRRCAVTYVAMWGSPLLPGPPRAASHPMSWVTLGASDGWLDRTQAAPCAARPGEARRSA